MKDNLLLNDIMDEVVQLLKKWKEQGAISGIIILNGLVKYNKFEEIEDCAQQLRKIESKIPKLQIMLVVEIKYFTRELVQKQIEVFKAKNINVSTKNTRIEHTDKIGFLIRPNY